MTLVEAIAEVRRVGSLTVAAGKLKIRFLDADRARLEPALAVLRVNREAAIEQVSTPPAKTLADVDPEARGISYAEWKACELNRIFTEHGTLKVPDRQNKAPDFTAATVQDGLDKYGKAARKEISTC